MENFPAWVATNPLASFTILLFASLTVPPLVERFKLPGLVGLLLAGVVLGPHGLKLLNPNSETIKLLSDIGKIYLMFVAGLEIDMRAFHRTRNRSLSFGLATFLVPLATGTLLGQAFGFGWNASILIGSLFASHTLLAYPIVQRLGVLRNEAITVTVGATIFTDIGALLVLAVCVSIHQGDFSWFSLPIQLGSLAVYAVTVLFGLDWLVKEYFRVIEQVFRSSPCPVAVMRLSTSPKSLTRILVPIWDVSPQTLQLIALAQRIATANQGKVTVLYHSSPSTASAKQAELPRELSQHLQANQQWEPTLSASVKIKAISSTDTTTVLRTAQHFDLTVLNAADVHPARGSITHDWATSLLESSNQGQP